MRIDLRAVVAFLASTMMVSACSGRADPPTPSSAVIAGLAEQDAKRFVGLDQCIAARIWPAVLPAKASTGERPEPRGMLDALVTVGLVQRKLEIRKEKAAAGRVRQTAAYIYAPAAKASKFFRRSASVEPLPKGQTRQAICLATIVFAGKVEQDGFFLQTGYSFAGKQTGRFVPVALLDDKTLVTRLTYALATEPSEQGLYDGFAKTFGKTPDYVEKNRGAYRRVYEEAAHSHRIVVEARNTGAGWQLAQ